MIRTAQTENGTVRGLPSPDPRVTAFKGIPFAAPPVGQNRWRAPQPCENWDGILNAYHFAPISVQDTPGLGTDVYCKEWHVDPQIPMDEDCLYLNVWTGAKSTEDKLPVLVWFFGGAFQWGYTAEMEFDGERIARRDVILVTVNYRLGPLGFLAHPQLTAEQPESPSNFGSLDQQAGLRWVKRNIAAFGGDPDNITIAGQSAGGASVLSQLTCEDNYPYIQKAVIMSGMFSNIYGQDHLITPAPLSVAEKKGEDFFEMLGVSTLEEARALDAFFIRDKYAEYAQIHPERMTLCIDGCFCKDYPLRLFMQNKCANIPLMAGNTGNEFPGFLNVSNEDALKRIAEELFKEDSEAFLSFPEAHTYTEGFGYGQMNKIACSVKGALLANEKRNDPKNCYYYEFDPEIPGPDHPGSFHSVELWFFFETLGKCWRPFTGKHFDLSRQICNYFTNFVKTGNPNGKDHDGSALPTWSPYTKNTPCEMHFTDEGCNTSDTCDAFTQFITDQIAKRI